jgi:hypothetical protein
VPCRVAAREDAGHALQQDSVVLLDLCETVYRLIHFYLRWSIAASVS